MTQIFSAKLLRGLVFLYDPTENKTKKNQAAFCKDKPSSPPSPLLHRSLLAHRLLSQSQNPAKYLVTQKKQFDRLQLGIAPIPNISQQRQCFSLFPDTGSLLIIEIYFLSVLIKKQFEKHKIHDSMLTIQRACQGFGHINQANAETQNESDAKSQKNKLF